MLSEDLRVIGPRDPSADLEVVFSDLRSEDFDRRGYAPRTARLVFPGLATTDV